jgi:hypothetical protein
MLVLADTRCYTLSTTAAMKSHALPSIPSIICIFAFADDLGGIGLRAVDRPLDAALAGGAPFFFFAAVLPRGAR